MWGLWFLMFLFYLVSENQAVGKVDNCLSQHIICHILETELEAGLLPIPLSAKLIWEGSSTQAGGHGKGIQRKSTHYWQTLDLNRSFLIKCEWTGKKQKQKQQQHGVYEKK